MNDGFTSKYLADHLDIPVGRIRSWVKQGHFNHLGVTRKRSFKFYDIEKSTEAILALWRKEEGPEREENIFDEIDSADHDRIQELQVKEELKALVIKNKKHNEEYILMADHQRALVELAHVIRSHFEEMPSRISAALGTNIEKEVHEFCVKELETLHLKVGKFV